MFDVIGVTRGHCEFCGQYQELAVLPEYPEENGHDTRGCERCWRAAHKAADLLALLRVAKAPKGKAIPKKPRRRAIGQRSAIAEPSDDSRHGVPVDVREPFDRPL